MWKFTKSNLFLFNFLVFLWNTKNDNFSSFWAFSEIFWKIRMTFEFMHKFQNYKTLFCWEIQFWANQIENFPYFITISKILAKFPGKSQNFTKNIFNSFRVFLTNYWTLKFLNTIFLINQTIFPFFLWTSVKIPYRRFRRIVSQHFDILYKVSPFQ